MSTNYTAYSILSENYAVLRLKLIVVVYELMKLQTAYYRRTIRYEMLYYRALESQHESA